MIAVKPRPPHVTAEWQCTKCNSTNRKFVLRGTAATRDRCVTCKTGHVVTPDPRPVRWNAKAE